MNKELLEVGCSVVSVKDLTDIYIKIPLLQL
jgi:hypothetical protein